MTLDAWFLDGATVAAVAAFGVHLSREVSALRASVEATFKALDKRLAEHADVHRELHSRVSRLEDQSMNRRSTDRG